MTSRFTLTLDGQSVETCADESLFDLAKRLGKTPPHLCSGFHTYNRNDGNCRLCVMEVEGERTLTASCMRKAQPDMVVHSQSERVMKARKMVIELLLADQEDRKASPDPNAHFWKMVDQVGQSNSRFAQSERIQTDYSHPALAVDLNACIHCTNCVRACRELQVNDVLSMARRGSHSIISFDQLDSAAQSTCVACGECVQACPTGALLPKHPQTGNPVPPPTQAEKVNSLCPFCGVGCQLTYHVEDDKIIRVDGRDGPANHEKLCVKGRFGFDYIHHAHRLTTPLIRREDAPKNPQERIDPANPFTHFRKASWQEALDLAAKGLRDVHAQQGPKGIAGFGSAKGSNEEAYLFQKLIRTGFQTNNVDHCTRLCHASSVAALMEAIGSAAVSAPFMDAQKADCIIVIGARPAQNHPVAAAYIKQAVKHGSRLIVMDPRGQALTRHADYHLQFKSGQDVALLNAMIHVIITDGLCDQNYIQNNVDGFQTIRDNIQNFSPENMAPVCGIDAETIRKVARLYATSDRSLIFWGMGVSQHIHGTDNARCLITLALITGQIGRAGTGLHPLRGQNNVQGASDAGLIPMVYPDYQPVTTSENQQKFAEFWQAPLDSQKGLTVVEIMHRILEDEIQAMYIMGENPAMSDPDAQEARRSLAHLKHLVVQDLFLTETAMLADVILPASAFAEKDGTFTNTNRQVQRGRKAVSPPGDARQDLWIIQEIARRVGLDWEYQGPADVFDEMTLVMPSLNGITWQRLENEDCATYPNDQAVIFGDGFPTPTGRGSLVPCDLVAPDEVADADYPFTLTTGRLLEHWHTGAMTRRSHVLNGIEGQAIAALNPKDLQRLQLAPGDQVRITTRRGYITPQVRSDRDVPVGMVFVPFCFFEAPANFLTNPKLDPFGKIPEFKTCAAKIEATN